MLNPIAASAPILLLLALPPPAAAAAASLWLSLHARPNVYVGGCVCVSKPTTIA